MQTETPTISFEIRENAEPIPGYVLIERIGRGGYGEVWKATAPGGLLKAVKFVHGCLDGKRASGELKALNRVKAVSHPFLLSLERIESIDGHLVIVSELADANLMERFEACREMGLEAIPRDELLRYMYEAADALDHLVQGHSLQHLDIKPENLLLVTNHIKVADFGLLKDLEETGASLVHGMTPKYSPPEVFKGRPDFHSDQYSLAVVFQEMLTGRLPFDGRTAAQLASQHLHSKPDLSSLPPRDRFVVGKALSKDANQRFESCKQFVERLAQRSSTVMFNTGATEQHGSGADASGSGVPQDSHNLAGRHDGQTMVVTKPEVKSLPAIDTEQIAASFRPTIFLGVGGTGSAVLCHLRQMMLDRMGGEALVGATRFLYIDTDVASIKAATNGERGGKLNENETLLLPLRQTKDYRSNRLLELASISRRWIYNIPRSLRTEGLRALGRLAFLDHAERLMETLRTAFSDNTSTEALASAASDLGFSSHSVDPRVFVVASVAGGTGGGMAVDLGYAVRQVLCELGLSDDDVSAVLTYSTGTTGTSCSFAPANAYACLDELRYFSEQNNDYPGEPARGFAGFRESSPTYKSTYFVDLGDDVTTDGFAESAGQMAEYLYLNSFSPVSAFFDTCRQIDRQRPRAENLELRTTGISHIGEVCQEVSQRWVVSLCRSLAFKWRGSIDTKEEDRIKPSEIIQYFESREVRTPHEMYIESSAVKKVTECGVELASVGSFIDGIIDEALGCDTASYFTQLVQSVIDSQDQDSNASQVVATAFRTIDAVTGCEAEQLEGEYQSQFQSLQDIVAPHIRSLGLKLGNTLEEWILDLVDDPTSRVTGSRHSVKWLMHYVKEISGRASNRINDLKQQVEQARATVVEQVSKKKVTHEQEREIIQGLVDYAVLRLQELEASSVHKTLSIIETEITNAADRLRDLWKDLNHLADLFQTKEDDHALIDQIGSPMRRDVTTEDEERIFVSMRTAMIEQLDDEIQKNFFRSELKLRDLFSRSTDASDDLVNRLQSLARKIIRRNMKAANLAQLYEQLKSQKVNEVESPLRHAVRDATPEILEVGGAKRTLLVTPKNIASDTLRDELCRVTGDEVSYSADSEANAIVCCEAEQLKLESVLARFLRRRSDCLELANRLYTRVDIDWPTQ